MNMLLQKNFQTGLGLSIALLIANLAAGVSLVSSLRLNLIFLVLGFGGYSLSRLIVGQLSQLSQLAIGVTVMIPIWTVLDQALRLVSLRFAALPLVGAFGFVAAFIHHVRQRRITNLIPACEAIGTNQVTILCLLAIILVAQTWIWLILPGFVSLVVIAVLIGKTSGDSVPSFTLRSGIVSCGAIAVALAWAILRRPTDWWLPGYGFDELEYLSNAAYFFGPAMDVHASGIPLSYQWLNFATLGLIEQAAGVGDFVVGTRVDFVVSGLLLALLVWGFMVDVLGNHRRALLAATIACLASTTMVYPNHYGLFGLNNRSFATVYLVAVPILVFVWARTLFRWSGFAPLLIVVHALLSVKTAVALPLAAVLTVGAVVMLITRNWVALTQLVVLGTTLGINLLLRVKSTSGMAFDVRRPWSFTKQFVGYENWLNATALVNRDFIFISVFAAMMLVAMTGIIAVALIGWLQLTEMRSIGVVSLASLGVGYLSVIFSERVSETQLHFLQVTVVALIPVVVVDFIRRTPQHRLLPIQTIGFLPVLTAIGTAIMIPVFAVPQSPVALSLPNRFQEGLPERLAVFGAIATCTVLVVTTIAAVTRRQVKSGLNRVDIVMCALLLFSVTNGAVNWTVLPIQPIMRSGVVEGQLGTPDLQSAAEWIVTNTDFDDVVASNAFFTDPTLADTCAFSRDEQAGWLTENAENQNFFTPMVLTKRRFVAAAPNYGSLASGVDFEPRVRASLLYACEPTLENREALQAFSARWYLAYLPRGASTFLAPDKVIFVSGPWMIVSLGAA
jgi:hypothetical protein